MQRKEFLGLGSALLAPWGAWLASPASDVDDFKLPRYLKPGDKIGITSPAGAITLEEMRPALAKLTEWGFNYVIGTSIGRKDFTRGGTDDERAQDLQQMLDDPSLRAILCARGGYGSVRIIDRLNWEGFKAHPKWLIGFSDITVLHCHINSRLQIASIHSKMTNSFPDDWSRADPIQKLTIESIGQVLKGEKMVYPVQADPANRMGRARGRLVGGNLKTIETLAGSRSDLHTNGRILFVEDTGEYLYSIDRMFWNLKRTGKLDQLAGLIVGGFRIKPDDPGDEFGKTLFEIVNEKLKGTRFPVCFNFPVGHQIANYALKCGVMHELEVTAAGVSLTDIS